HKEKHNLMYVLSPADSYQKGLVKKIEVYGVEESDTNEMMFQVKEIKTKKGQSPTANVLLEVKTADGEYVNKSVLIKHGESLFRKSRKNDKYGDLQVNEISAQHSRVELSDGKFYKLEEETSANKEAVFRTQIRETLKAHFNKQDELGDNIKVLSLFFIDKVENYMSDQGIIRKIFVDEFNKLKTNYSHFSDVSVDSVHNGYFANKKYKGEIIFKDTTGKTKADKEVYDLIMKDKEKLLSFEEPTCFIFSHSALKEGWDNPNVFQICTLNETKSQSKKRQEIGRGLRLCLNTDGDRQFDPNINILTVVANESYKDFVGSLQTEYTDAGYKSSIPAANARRRVNVKFRKHLATDNEDFKKLWDKIRKRTKYNIDFDEQKLISGVTGKINELDVANLVVRVEKVLVDFADGGKLKTIDRRESAGERLDSKIHIGNVINRIVKETEVTKQTIIEILSKIENLDLLFENPEEFTRSVIVLIQTAKNELLINEGLKYTPVGDVWEINLFEDMKGYQKNTMDSQKSAYERVLCDSKQELEFAHNLEISNRVKLYTKLPPKFVVDTPLGTYNPDWAIVVKTDEGDKLYLVRETKFVNDLANLRPSELQKIICGEKHFQAIGVDFKVCKDKELNDLE
ncbi:DEAD/DEAH box helicase, partial [Patescibacteria group bacterium]|nr:DEAD/DEAH box helicase [Patescibacteria group bacterium]